jgi:hypothetical protein
MPFDVAAELKSQIAKEDDKDRRTLLMLLLGVLEANIEGMAAISTKIDNLINDEQSLRAAVLNGHAENHDRDHEWVAIQIYRAKETEGIRTWALRRMASTCESGCEWAEKKRLEEIETTKNAVEDAKADKRTARDAIIRTVVASLTSAVITGLSVVAFLK